MQPGLGEAGMHTCCYNLRHELLKGMQVPRATFLGARTTVFSSDGFVVVGYWQALHLPCLPGVSHSLMVQEKFYYKS